MGVRDMQKLDSAILGRPRLQAFWELGAAVELTCLLLAVRLAIIGAFSSARWKSRG